MPNYEVDYSYKIEEYGTVPVTADTKEQADQFAREYVQDTYDQCFGIEIEEVREITHV